MKTFHRRLARIPLLLVVLLVACPSTQPPGPQPVDITVTGTVVFDTGGPVEGATVVGSTAQVTAQGLRTLQSTNATTDASGNFSLVLNALLPVKIAVDVGFLEPTTGVTVDTAKTRDTNAAAVDLGTVQIPNPVGAEITISGGAGESSDGAIEVSGLPPEVDSLFGRSYDPDATPEAFPGEFAENGQIPLNSSNFLWMEALDAQGNPVDDFASAATIRTRVPQTQWIDLEDIDGGTDRIEVPMYTFNEATQVWEQMAEVGWLEDDAGTILPEDAQPTILDGTFAGELYATFRTGHLSWMNVDYAYIGPWTLSRLDRDNRNNDCLYNALQLARTIALSQTGRAAYGKVNQPGADLGQELSDGAGPELKNEALAGEYGVYRGDSGGSETEFGIANFIWNGCGEGATEAQKKNTTLIMAVTILHETAHWKDDVKKYPDDDTDTAGEEGNQLERDIFGGVITLDGNTLKSDGNPVPDATRDRWLDPANWPPPAGNGLAADLAPSQATSPLEVTIALDTLVFELGEEIPVEVTFTNTSNAPIQAMTLLKLEGYPLYFDIVDQDTNERARFLGPEIKLPLTDADFAPLAPGASRTQTVQLLRDPADGSPRYRIFSSGAYEITAVYEPFRGVTKAVSNTLTVTIGAGGSITGSVTDSSSGASLGGALVKLLDGSGNLLDSASSDANGGYSFPEVPQGTYTLEASAPGFLRSTRTGVSVTTGQNTVVNFSLSPLLATGELRLVLTWGESPSDLDSHLWLPEEVPYHLYYSRRGLLDACPWAALDVDETSGLGPETITIAQRVTGGSYAYAIYNYSGTPDITTSEAQVQVFDATGLLATFDVPATGTGLWWHVLDIDGATGAVTEVNQVLEAEPAPYADTDAGCSNPVPASDLRAPGSQDKP